MHAPATAEGDQGEVARVVATVDRDELQRIDHVVVRDADDAPGGLDRLDHVSEPEPASGPPSPGDWPDPEPEPGPPSPGDWPDPEPPASPRADDEDEPPPGPFGPSSTNQ